jgi:phospholipid/cholesterol/gamma-HCH transport system substrate-binding protein
MSKSRLEWKVGLFVFIGLVVLGGLLIEFTKGTSPWRHTYTIRLRAGNVGGLKVRSTVLMSGVQVGTVSDIKLSPDGKSVTMTLKIYDQYIIHKDARFVIEQSGFLGDNYVSILPTLNQGDVFREGGEAHADAPFNLQEVARSAAGFIQRIDEVAQRLNETIADVRHYVLNEQTLTNLSAAVSRLRGFSEEALATVDDIHRLVITNRPALDTAGSNLVVFSQQLNQFGSGLNGIIATNSPGINEVVKNIESSTVVLKNLLNDLQEGKGLAGSLIKDEDAAMHVSQIASNLSITTSNLNRLGLWGILWQHKPPRTNNPPASQPFTAPKHSFD